MSEPHHAAFDPTVRLGRSIAGRFLALRVIGHGGFGDVYGGVQNSTGMKVAIKVIRPELFDKLGPDAIGEIHERFEREARALAEMNHPNIVRLVDAGRDRDTGEFYIVMELVEGTGLDALFERHRFTEPLVAELGELMLRGLVEAHTRGIVHRDIKPSNVMCARHADGRLAVKLLDFGIALDTLRERVTGSGARGPGTPMYMSPEQLLGVEVGPQSDVFSVGLILFEAASGQPYIDPELARSPVRHYKHLETLDVRNRILNAIPEDALSPALLEALVRALDVDPARRHQSAMELLGHIERVCLTHQPVRLERAPALAESLTAYARPRRPGAASLPLSIPQDHAGLGDVDPFVDTIEERVGTLGPEMAAVALALGSSQSDGGGDEVETLKLSAEELAMVSRDLPRGAHAGGEPRQNLDQIERVLNDLDAHGFEPGTLPVVRGDEARSSLSVEVTTTFRRGVPPAVTDAQGAEPGAHAEGRAKTPYRWVFVMGLALLLALAVALASFSLAR